jgi:hypothetical protein
MAGIEDLRETLGITELHRGLVEIRDAIMKIQPVNRPAWYNLRAACELKGIAYNTIKSRPDLQPNGGSADATIAGRRVWRCLTIDVWLNQIDPVKRVEKSNGTHS